MQVVVQVKCKLDARLVHTCVNLYLHLTKAYNIANLQLKFVRNLNLNNITVCTVGAITLSMYTYFVATVLIS